jgi:hypothetical protein
MPVFMALLALALGGASVYRWTDADGVVHYSDRPNPGAQRVVIDVPPAATVRGPARREGSNAPDEEFRDFTGYDSLTITSPGQDATLWNIEGQLDVRASVQPALQQGHRLQFQLDGRTIPVEPGRLTARLSAVFRGEHNLRAEILDESGQVLTASAPSRFFVRQTAVANSAPSPAPRP